MPENNERLVWSLESGGKSLCFAQRGHQLWVEIHQGDEVLATIEITGRLLQIYSFISDVLIRRVK
jgi:hypothetical protein